jgi:hypothetical protein
LCKAPLARDSTSHGVGGAIHVHIPSHRRVPGDALREHVATGSKIPPEGVEALMVSCIPRMHAVVSLCKKPGLSCPKFFLPLHYLQFLQWLLWTSRLYARLSKIYKIDNAPVRLMATGRMLECLTFGIFLDTTTAVERPYAELPSYR